MKTHLNPLVRTTGWRVAWLLPIFFGLMAGPLIGATSIIYSNSFEGYATVATDLSDAADADPTGAEWSMVDDTALTPTTAGAGVQVINWLTNHTGTVANKCLLVRPSSEADIYLPNTKSGSQYQLDFWACIARYTNSDRSFRFDLRGEGADLNGDDFLAYGTVQTTNNTTLRMYDGVKTGPGWVSLPVQAITNQWQHHRMVIDPRTRYVTLYIDDMINPITTTGRLARSAVAVPTVIKIVNEANTADDGWWAIDDVSLTVTDSVNLLSTITEGFESYPARASAGDDANPLGAWITVETDGAGASGAAPAPSKVQVVDSSVTTPHTGSKCLKLEAGQRAGSSIAWGQTPFTDVQITWWAKVPTVTQNPAGSDAVYLRMSLYGQEAPSTAAGTVWGDSALLGYGIRMQNSTNLGGAQALLYYAGTAWVDSKVTFTPDVWEEYQLTTANALGTYDIVKNPSSGSPVVIVNHAPMIGTAPFGPTFMAAWSTSNGTNHLPVYVDDITIMSGVFSNSTPLGTPYTVQYDGGRFTNSTVLRVGGPIGGVTVDPRDGTTLIVASDAASGGGIYQAKKVAAGNWSPDFTPIVNNLANPSGVAVQPSDGTLWWTHDFGQSVMRLRWPWTTNVPEQVVADFVCSTNDPAAGAWLDDDPCDLVFPPANFNGTISQTWPGSSTWPTTVSPSQLVVLDRGTDFNGDNALYLVDPSTSLLSQTNYDWYLLPPSISSLGSVTMVGMTTLPASGEIVTLNQDGQVTAVSANGIITRSFWPELYQDPYVAILPACIATDPTTGRLWIGDQLWRQVFSCAPDGTDCRVELSFPLVDTNRADQQIQFHVPGGSMAFAPDGSFVAISDNSTINAGGRLLVLHNEAFAKQNFAITGGSQSGQGVQLTWGSAGAVSYTVQRGADLANAASFQNLVTNLNVRQFTDTNALSSGAFYRVIATPTLTP